MKWLRSRNQHADPQPSHVPQIQTFDSKHTPSNPYCSDPTCWCHTSVSYHDAVQHPERQVTAADIELAYAFLFPSQFQSQQGGEQ